MQKPPTTNRQEQQQLDDGEQQLHNEITKERLFEAMHFACMRISDEVVEEVRAERDVKLQFDGCVLAQVAHLVTDALCDTWPDDLLLFARHGKRSIVNVNDVKLLVRRNESLVKLMDEESGKMPSTRRQKSVPGLRSESSNAADGEDSNEAKKSSSRTSSIRRRGAPKKKSDSKRILNASRITDFLMNDSEPMASSSKVTSLNGTADDEHSHGSMLRSEWQPLERHSDAVTDASFQGESSPLEGFDGIVYDDLSNPLTVKSSGKTLAGPSKKILKVDRKVKNNEGEVDWGCRGEQRGRKVDGEQKSLKDRNGACKRKAPESSTATSTLNESVREDKIIASSRDIVELEHGDTDLAKIFNSVVDKASDANEFDVMRIERSKVRRFAQKYEKDEKLSVINRQGIYKNNYKEAPSAFYKAMLNSKRTVDRVKLEGVDSSNGNHLHKTLNEPASVEASPICPISIEHLGRESIVRSGGSSRDIFASPSPKSCNIGRCKDAMNVDKVSRSDDIINDPSIVHRIGACRNLSETLQSQQSELTTAICRRSSATSEEDSIDSSVWDAIDFNAIDAAVIGTSHRQQQSNGKAVMNQRGGLMSAERTTEERLVTSTERDISEKRTARVGHKLDGFSDFNFESDEDEDVRIDTIASSNLERREKDGGNDRRMGNSISLSKQMEQSDVVTTVLERQHGELKNRISKEFSAFTFESDEEEEVEEKMPATRSINSEVPTITSTTRASNTAKESTIGNFSIFNFESDESEEGCRMRTATPSIDISKSSNRREASATDMGNEVMNFLEDDCDLDATIFD